MRVDSYWRLNPEFPNQSTANQFYVEMQFDSYRELGLQLMSGIIGDAADVTIERLFERSLEEEKRADELLEREVA